MTIFHELKCPVEKCPYHDRLIKGPLSILKNHIFRDHDYLEKLKTAVKFGLIESPQEKRSAKWLSEQLSTKGIQ